MENNKNKTTNINQKKSEPLNSALSLIGKEVTLILNVNSKAPAKIFGVRYSKGKIHYDLHVNTDNGLIPFYNIDSVIIKF